MIEKKVLLTKDNVILKEYLDIIYIFNNRTKMKEFLKFFLIENWKLAQDLEAKNEWCLPLFIDKYTGNIAIDYGSLLYFLKEFLVKKYGAERNEADRYIYGYFSISVKTSMNIPNAFLLKIIFGEIYRIAIFIDCKLRTFFNQTMVIEGFNNDEYFTFNAIYFSKNTLQKMFENDEFFLKFVIWFKSKSVNIVAKNNLERDKLVRKNKQPIKRLFKIFKTF